MGSALMATKKDIREELEDPDSKADLQGLADSELGRRYSLEDEMPFISKCEELYWQLRGY